MDLEHDILRKPGELQQFRNCYRPKARTQVAFSSRKSHLSLLSKSLCVFRNCSRRDSLGWLRLSCFGPKKGEFVGVVLNLLFNAHSGGMSAGEAVVKQYRPTAG